MLLPTALSELTKLDVAAKYDREETCGHQERSEQEARSTISVSHRGLRYGCPTAEAKEDAPGTAVSSVF